MTPNLRTYNSSSVVLVVWQELPIWLRPVKRWTPTSYFNSCLAHRPHVSSENTHRKRVFSKTPCRAEIFKNTAGLSFTRGWTKTRCHASFTTCITHALWRMLSYFNRISIVWKRFECATCGRVFFRKRRGKISVSKLSGYVLTGT